MRALLLGTAAFVCGVYLGRMAQWIRVARNRTEVLAALRRIEIHPWGASVDNIDHTDRLIFDLDPAPDVPFEGVKLAAQNLRKRLNRRGLEGMLNLQEFWNVLPQHPRD